MDMRVGAVPADEKFFVGIGKMIFNTSGVEWNIPHLHFMVDKNSDGIYEATVLEFGLVSSAEDEEEAIKRLAELARTYILSVMKNDNGYSQFLECVNDFVMCDYWRHYRYIEFSLAKKGKDLSHNMDQRLANAIKSTFTEKTIKYIDGIARESAANIITEIRRIMMLAPPTLEYTSILDKAA
jgi:hypothetical protein